MSDWGQGAKNNDIGWGQGAVNNDISWGSVHANSWAGGTDIVGSTPLLLDTYTNAAAAYSLRLLRSDYTGSAIRVRRASDNSEMNIGFVNNELDTSTLTNFCIGTNGFVTTWYDQSGNSMDATQTTAANQPQIVSSGSVIAINTKSAINFDGTNDTLSFTALTTAATDMSAFLVRNIASYPSVFRTLFSYRTYGITYNSSGGIQYGDGAHVFGTNQAIKSNDYPKTTGQALDFIYNLQNLERNDFTATLLTTAPYSSQQNTIGGVNATVQLFLGDIQEIIIYESNKNSNKSAIKTNINSYYGIY